MLLGETEQHQPMTTLSVSQVKSWLNQEVFWMGVFSSLLAGTVIYFLLERKHV